MDKQAAQDIEPAKRDASAIAAVPTIRADADPAGSVAGLPQSLQTQAQALPNPIVDAASDLIAAVRIDDDMLAVLKTLDGLAPLAVEKLDPVVARRQPTLADAVRDVLDMHGRDPAVEDLVPAVHSMDIDIDGAAGSIKARVYTPDQTMPTAGWPVILFFHGGGWVLGDRVAYDASARGLAHASQAVVVSVDYRLAPEHRFPAAWDDAVAAYRWLVKRPMMVQGNARQIALAGEGAGGNLALATAIAARDSGLPQPVHVLAIHPIAQTGTNTESYIENAIAKPLNRAMMKWFFAQVARRESDLDDSRLSLVHADLSGLPSVSLLTARVDPLRCDSNLLEAALKKAGVEVERLSCSGVTHDFFGAAAVVAQAEEAQAWAGQRLRACFERR